MPKWPALLRRGKECGGSREDVERLLPCTARQNVPEHEGQLVVAGAALSLHEPLLQQELTQHLAPAGHRHPRLLVHSGCRALERSRVTRKCPKHRVALGIVDQLQALVLKMPLHHFHQAAEKSLFRFGKVLPNPAEVYELLLAAPSACRGGRHCRSNRKTPGFEPKTFGTNTSCRSLNAHHSCLISLARALIVRLSLASILKSAPNQMSIR
jgi:hypothetical protein